jgi:choline-glycine betaine transporter
MTAADALAAALATKGEGWGLGFWCCWTLMGRLLVYSSFVFYLPEDV